MPFFRRTSFFLMVGVAGLEPARYCYQRILSPLRLPITPHSRLFRQVEVPAGIEPAVAELQSAALPLGYGTTLGFLII